MNIQPTNQWDTNPPNTGQIPPIPDPTPAVSDPELGVNQAGEDAIRDAYNKMINTDYLQTMPKEKDKLIRSDFKKVHLKGEGNKYYFSWVSHISSVEICLEPCFSGFCVAAYKKNPSDYRYAPGEERDPFGPDIIDKKICTNMNLGEKFFMKELMEGTQERSSKIWHKALEIANEIFRGLRNTDKLKRWGMIPDPNKHYMGGAGSSCSISASKSMGPSTSHTTTSKSSKAHKLTP